MDSTTRRTENKPKKDKKSFLSKVFGGEFLLRKEMRPWYWYALFLFALMVILVVSEQRINEKKQKINDLENEYKAELSKLKANNQFIPYEENQILIQQMKDRGYVLDEEHNYTIVVKKPVEEKRHILFFWKNKKKNKNAQEVEIPQEADGEEPLEPNEE